MKNHRIGLGPTIPAEKSKKCTCKKCGKTFDKPWQVAQHTRMEHKKRAKAKAKSVKVSVNGVVPQGRDLNWCPRCGCNLGAVKVVSTW